MNGASNRGGDGALASSSGYETAGQRVGTLRGAGVDIDRRRVGRIALALVLVALAASSAALFVVGAHKNSQINQLRASGIPVGAKVVTCLGLLGGSGSNAAGYACHAAYVVGGHHYDESVPGVMLLKPGSTVHVIVAAGNPSLLTTPAVLAGEHASWHVFILPGVLLLSLLVLVVLLIRHRVARTEDETIVDGGSRPH